MVSSNIYIHHKLWYNWQEFQISVIYTKWASCFMIIYLIEFKKNLLFWVVISNIKVKFTAHFRMLKEFFYTFQHKVYPFFIRVNKFSRCRVDVEVNLFVTLFTITYDFDVGKRRGGGVFATLHVLKVEKMLFMYFHR